MDKQFSYRISRLIISISLLLPLEVYGECLNDAIITDSLSTDSAIIINKIKSSDANSHEDAAPINNVIPKTPQAAALARYGDIPVSYASGVPEISIPLYTIQQGGFQLPISISYHASGIKVSDIATSVGLGWVLNAGGAITRSVHGSPDLETDYLSERDTLYRSYKRVNALIGNAAKAGSRSLWPLLPNSNNAFADYDTESDRYTFNFAGKSGAFVYSYKDRAFVTLDYQPFIINAAGGDKSHFVIYDNDGNIYYFDVRESTGVPDDGGYIAVCAWYLSKIRTKYGDIDFAYAHFPDIYSYSRSMQLRFGPFPKDDPAYKNEFRNTWKLEDGGIAKHVMRPVLLTEITWNGNRITFMYANDRKDIGVTRLRQMVVTNSDGDVVRTADFNNSSYLGYDSLTYRMLLSSIILSNEGKYQFEYDKYNTMPSYIDIHGLDNRGQRMQWHEDYWGYYNGSSTNYPFPRNLAKELYHEIDNSTSYSDGAYWDGEREPDSYFAKTGILTGITYPTGGTVHFEYELNTPSENVGGLRIKSISSGNVKRTFTYRNHNAYDRPENLMWKQAAQVYKGDFLGYLYLKYLVCLSSPYFSDCGSYTTSAFYPYVRETYSNGDCVDYEYMRGVDDCGATALTPSTTSDQHTPEFAASALYDSGTSKPLLTLKTWYGGGKAIREEAYTYDQWATKRFATGVRVAKILAGELDDLSAGLESVVCEETGARVNYYSLSEKTTTDLVTGVTVSEVYSYLKNFPTLAPKSVTTTGSDGKSYSTVYTYGCEKPGNTAPDDIIDVVKYCGSTELQKTHTDYVLQNGFYYPEAIRKSVTGGISFEKYRMEGYNVHGNPSTFITNRADTSVVVWDNAGIYPLELRKYGKTIGTYSWKPLVGVASITRQNGYKVSYSYDSGGRLSKVYDKYGTRQEYFYHYRNGGNEASATGNYVDALTSSSPNAMEKSTNRQYYDYFGRPALSADNGIGGRGNFVLSLLTYDNKGRQLCQYLPISGQSMNEIEEEGFHDLAKGTYYDVESDYAYSENSYDALDRITCTTTPGEAWHAAGKSVKKEYLTNGRNDVWLYTAPMDGRDKLVKSGYYEPCQLFGEKTTDEDGHSLTTYTDKLGRKVLERRSCDDGDNDTYFVYNDLGQLRFVLSPEYQRDPRGAIYCYEYRYDNRGNIVKKMLPQCGYIQYWHDTAGRLIYMQDGRMRNKGLYRFYLYDNLSRAVAEGTCSACNRGGSVTHTAFNASNAGFLGTGYTFDHDPGLENPKLEVVSYYDNYDYLSLPIFKDNAALKKAPRQESAADASGLSTGSITSTSRDELLLTSLYYDAKGQVTESRRTLPGDALLVTKNTYSFTGNIDSTEQALYKGGKVYGAVTCNTYNPHNDKLASTSLSLDGSQFRNIRSITYDDLGRIHTVGHGSSASNSLGGGRAESTYTYNLRGWVTGIAGRNFEERLTYSGGQGTPCYNGNISTQQWRTGDEARLRGYKFTYDKLNRLTDAVYGEGSAFTDNAGRYDERITGYTANGAITGILRNGLKQDGLYGAIDSLDITLNGNQPASIEEKAAPVLRAGSFDFRKATHSSEGQGEAEYLYDENGALVRDSNRGITSIEYDLRNNPVCITFSDKSRTEYVYAATGEKLRTVHYSSVYNTAASSITPMTKALPAAIGSGQGAFNPIKPKETLFKDSADYLESFTFENGKPDKYLFAGGYYAYPSDRLPSFGGGGGGLYFYFADHLGNNRVVVDANDSIVQATHYYPFGAVYADAGKNPSFQKYKYTGKELDLVHGLNTYDHGARQNYSLLGVWDRVDPMAEKYYNISPYVVCGNNPIKLSDPTGQYSFDSTVCNNTYYPVIAIFPSNLNDHNGAILGDYEAAERAEMPLIRIDDINDLKNAMEELSQRGISTSCYTINSHGTGGSLSEPANFMIGNEKVTYNTDFSSLIDGFEGHNIFIGACNVGNDFGNGQILIMNMARQTQSTVIASDHVLYSGYQYDGSYGLNNGGYENGFTMSTLGLGTQKIYNVTINKDKGMDWSLISWFLPSIINR